MNKPRKAIGYVCDIPILGTDLVIGKDFQKQRIMDYARRENIALAGIYEDEKYREDFMEQPGVKSVLASGPDIDAVLVERVWSLSRKRKELEPFIRLLDKKRMQLVCGSYLWDCLSQMVRHRYLGALAERQHDAALAVVEKKQGKEAA